jgi:hypothetical protein
MLKNKTHIRILRISGAAANNFAKTTSRHGEKFEKRASEKTGSGNIPKKNSILIKIV